mmetsp:Transcript_11325/g.22897  ORF Transcript_11325/g.22897 Transcript_11325/m.22897 type:complete len:272 (+) Transcript_11325:929-1744(+)
MLSKSSWTPPRRKLRQRSKTKSVRHGKKSVRSMEMSWSSRIWFADWRDSWETSMAKWCTRTAVFSSCVTSSAGCHPRRVLGALGMTSKRLPRSSQLLSGSRPSKGGHRHGSKAGWKRFSPPISMTSFVRFAPQSAHSFINSTYWFTSAGIFRTMVVRVGASSCKFHHTQVLARLYTTAFCSPEDSLLRRRILPFPFRKVDSLHQLFSRGTCPRIGHRAKSKTSRNVTEMQGFGIEIGPGRLGMRRVRSNITTVCAFCQLLQVIVFLSWLYP